jgi:hypothetical protein
VRRQASLLALVAALATPALAAAFCRARTCDPANPKQQCAKDSDECVTSGRQLFWPTSCLTFDAQADGSTKLGIDAETLTSVTAQAFAPWLRADCGGAAPSLEVGTLGPVECAEAGFNENARNANIVMFRDDVWPYPGSIDAYALTFVSFDPATGKIVDADIEINSADFNLTTDGLGAGVDLQTVLTHEVGHFFGLAHARPDDRDATMQAFWNGRGTELRTLSADDEAGICELFPPQKRAPRTCEPVHGFGSGCNEPSADVDEDDGGCAMAARKSASPPSAWSLLLVVLAFVRRSRRRALLK